MLELMEIHFQYIIEFVLPRSKRKPNIKLIHDLERSWSSQKNLSWVWSMSLTSRYKRSQEPMMAVEPQPIEKILPGACSF